MVRFRRNENENKKRKAAFYLQNRWNEWKRSVARSTEEEKLHTRSGLFYRISIGHGTSVRSERAYVTRNIELSYYFLLSLSLSAYTARHRSGVNTLTVASQFPIVFFFSITMFDIFTGLLNTALSIH